MPNGAMKKLSMLAFALGISVVGCNIDDDSTLITNNDDVNNTNNQNNTNQNNTNQNNSNNQNNNSNNANNQVESPLNANQFCAAAGVSRGSGVVAISCLGASDLSGIEARGNGMVWQPGAARLTMGE